MVDKKCEHEELVKAIESSKCTKFSMGCLVESDVCTVCGEKHKLSNYQVLQEDDGYCD